MAAQDAVVLENHVKLFVETKVGEAVTLEFSTGHVSIKPLKKQGSVTLGAFWARVIQAYFPSPEFTYSKSYSSSCASEVLTTIADGYSIKIYLRTGLVVVQGDVVYEWFKVIFRKVIQHYDRSTYSLPADYSNQQYILDTRKELQKPEKRVLFRDEPRPEIIDSDRALVSSDIYLPEVNKKFTDDDDTDSPYEKMQLVPCEPSSQRIADSIGLKDGNTYVYPLWKQLLNKWLSVDGCKVYVCSKHIDVTRYKDLATMAYKHRLNSGIEAIYTNIPRPDGMRMPTVKDKLMKGHNADEQLFIEYKIINKTRLAATKDISSNFIAGAYMGGQVELLLTSASFDEEGLDKSQNLHTVVRSKISAEDFTSNFLDKLATI